MTIFLDLAGSLVVRASMVAVMLGLTVTMNNALYETTQQTNATATLSIVGDVVYNDLTLADSASFTYADATRMDFKSDSCMTPISYTVGNAATPGQLCLFRQASSQTVCMSENLQSIQFEYFDVNGSKLQTPVADPTKIDAIRVKLLAKIDGVSQGISTALNDFKVFPPNLN